MAALIHVAGPSGSGKTTVIEALTARFRGKGYAVGVLKHCGHGFQADPAGKDGERLLAAGAQARALVGPALASVTTTLAGDDDPLRLCAQLLPPTLDVVFVEGYKAFRGLPRVSCDASRLGVWSFDPLDRWTSDRSLAEDAPVREYCDAGELAAVLEQEVVLPSRRKMSVSLRVDGKSVPMKDFVEDLVGGVVGALVRSLKGGETAGAVELDLRLPAPPENDESGRASR